ncbi:glycoside hydrolase family 26 protein [Catenuloplanes atrovinosus]|uniref:GH26 domain-containing protein n=1 Tax=Catenuloplanes atrovinosus TaxID=137266 RepID=A0AAE3YHF9_9ACTN|nr:glycosyl hydrolase [Catenuloplanes atrovinosus]MDR7273470.1 hypothetical protein [Catenuloplanes atrovinosus]
MSDGADVFKLSDLSRTAREERRGRIRFRVWMTVHTIALLGLAGWVLLPESTGSDLKPIDSRAAAAAAMETTAPPTKEDVLAIPGVRFGLSAPQVPYSATELERISEAAGSRPTMLQFFVKWTETLRPESIELAYLENALPVVSWEPWAGSGAGEDQPEYALARIASGAHDDYIRAFATTVRDSGLPVALRFAHEMNGTWYPWSERHSGNAAGDYVKAWRHVHDTFREVGADNVIWVWSPNILRPVPNVSLAALYPGDEYVDWAGLVGYAVREKTAREVFEPTITAIRKITDKPFLITETGAVASDRKVGWITDFFTWLPTQEGLVGFVWFEFSDDEGGTEDWRFSADSRCAAAFSAGMSTLTPAAPPLGS